MAGAWGPAKERTGNARTVETAAIELKEVLLVGVVGHSFDVGTELGPYVSRAMPEVIELIAGFVRRRGAGRSAATPA